MWYSHVLFVASPRIPPNIGQFLTMYIDTNVVQSYLVCGFPTNTTQHWSIFSLCTLILVWYSCVLFLAPTLVSFFHSVHCNIDTNVVQSCLVCGSTTNTTQHWSISYHVHWHQCRTAVSCLQLPHGYPTLVDFSPCTLTPPWYSLVFV